MDPSDGALWEHQEHTVKNIFGSFYMTTFYTIFVLLLHVLQHYVRVKRKIQLKRSIYSSFT